MKATDKKLIELCSKIEQLTDDNYHTEAKIIIAKFFKYDNYVKIFQAINTINDAEGYLTPEINSFRLRKCAEMIDQIKRDFGQDTADKVYKSL